MTNVINKNEIYANIADTEITVRNGDVYSRVNFNLSSEAGELLYKIAVKQETMTAIILEEAEKSAKRKHDEDEGSSFYQHEEETQEIENNFHFGWGGACCDFVCARC